MWKPRQGLESLGSWGWWTVGVWLGKVCWMRSVGKVVLPIADIIVFPAVGTGIQDALP